MRFRELSNLLKIVPARNEQRQKQRKTEKKKFDSNQASFKASFCYMIMFSVRYFEKLFPPKNDLN
jgi:hypothetical protein